MSCVKDTEIHVGDVGTTFGVTITAPETEEPVDISAATAITFIFERPNDLSALVGPGALVDGGTTGRAAYTWQEGDLAAAGTWKVQVHVTTPTRSFYSSTVRFTVKRNILGDFQRTPRDSVAVEDSVVVS